MAIENVEKLAALGPCDPRFLDLYNEFIKPHEGSRGVRVTLEIVMMGYDCGIDIFWYFNRRLPESYIRRYAVWCAEQIAQYRPADPSALTAEGVDRETQEYRNQANAEAAWMAKDWPSTQEAAQHCGMMLRAVLMDQGKTKREVVEIQAAKLVELLNT
jgi:hypothetical protein